MPVLKHMTDLWQAEGSLVVYIVSSRTSSLGQQAPEILFSFLLLRSQAQATTLAFYTGLIGSSWLHGKHYIGSTLSPLMLFSDGITILVIIKGILLAQLFQIKGVKYKG